MTKKHELLLNIKPSPEDEIEDLQRLTLQLRQDINELDVERVEYIRSKEIPPGAKSGDIVAWGSLLVSLATSAAAGSGGVLPALIATVQSWLKRRQEKRSISIDIGGDKLEVSAISSEDQKRIIDTWINRQEEKMSGNV
jgi:Effector Associated Constant Component 1